MMTPLMCLAAAVFFEARGEPIDAQTFVAEVVINRVNDDRYPDTVCDVVFEDRQFSFTHDGQSDDITAYNTFFDAEAQTTATLIAEQALASETSITSTHYHTVSVSPAWRDAYALDGTYGTHVFYTNETAWR